MLRLRPGRIISQTPPKLYTMRSNAAVCWTRSIEKPGGAYSGGNSYIVQPSAVQPDALNLVSINGCGETRWYARVPADLSEIAQYWQGAAEDTREALDYFFEEVTR